MVEQRTRNARRLGVRFTSPAPYDIFRLCSFRRMAKTLEKGLKCMTFFSCILYVLVLWKMLFLKRCICRRDTLKQE